MSSRQSTDITSQSGVSYPSGSASSNTQKHIAIGKNTEAMLNSKLGKGGAFNGHAVEIWADGSVWDTVSGVYLFPGKDYNISDLQRK